MKSRQTVASMLAVFFIASAVVLLSGCGDGNPADSMIAANNDSNIKRLASMYSLFHLRNNFKGPKDEAELKDFIRSQNADRLARAGINLDEVDSLFSGERDGQPFKIRYGLDTYIRGPSMPVIFEVEGMEGMRQVGFTNGSMQEVDSTEYDLMWSGKRDDTPAGDGRQ
jgi:hypothetical protein